MANNGKPKLQEKGHSTVSPFHIRHPQLPGERLVIRRAFGIRWLLPIGPRSYDDVVTESIAGMSGLHRKE